MFDCRANYGAGSLVVATVVAMCFDQKPCYLFDVNVVLIGLAAI